jgi:hypothetical protein
VLIVPAYASSVVRFPAMSIVSGLSPFFVAIA